MAFWIYSIACLVVILFLLYLYTSRHFNYWKKRNVFHLKAKPFFGNFFNVLILKEYVGEWLQEIYNSAKNEPYVGIWVFGQPYLVLRSPTLIKNIIQKDFAYFEDRIVTAPENDELLSHMMFFMKNPDWKQIRTKVSPVFTTGKLKIMFSSIQSESQVFVDYLRKNPICDAKYVCETYSVNVIAITSFGLNAKAFENESSEFRAMSNSLFDLRLITTYRQLASWFWPEIVNAFNIEAFDRWIRVRLETILNEVLHVRAQSPNQKPKDIIDLLLQIRETNSDEPAFSHSKMLAQAVQFFTAGFETVSTTMSFLLYELALDKNLQDRLRKEILDKIKERGELNYESLIDMQFLDMCFSETVRKYPVLPFLDRRCNANYKVEETGLVIEKGTPILIPMLGIHRDPKYHPEPLKWNPDRFLGKNKINNDGFNYFPFGEGPRICIGERFGKLSVKLGIATILTNFEVELTPDTPVPIKFVKPTIFLLSDRGLPLNFVPFRK